MLRATRVEQVHGAAVPTIRIRLIIFSLSVKIWDLVGEDQSLKGEYKVLGGRM